MAASVVLQAAASALGKQAGIFSAGRGVAALVVNPWAAAVFAALGLQAVCWIQALRRLPLSLAYPFMSGVLPLNLLCAWALFGERVRLSHWLGMALMCVGIVLLGREAGLRGPDA